MILDKWFQSPMGQSVVDSVQKQFEVSGMNIWGDCLQVGTSAEILPKKRNHHLKKIRTIAPELMLPVDIHALVDELPFVNQSFPMVFLPFTLEFLNDTTKILDEVARVLTPDGYLLILGVNPWSLWGGTHLLNPKAIWSSKWYSRSSLRIYSQLSSRNFQSHWIKSFFYRPPFSSAKLLKKSRFLEPVGQMFWPYPGGLYLLLAQKLTPELLPVEPLWRAGGYVFGRA